MARDLSTAERAELERMQRDGVEATLERWKVERRAQRRACGHLVIEYRGGELPQCTACGATQVGSIWADPDDGTLHARVAEH